MLSVQDTCFTAFRVATKVRFPPPIFLLSVPRILENNKKQTSETRQQQFTSCICNYKNQKTKKHLKFRPSWLELPVGENLSEVKHGDIIEALHTEVRQLQLPRCHHPCRKINKYINIYDEVSFISYNSEYPSTPPRSLHPSKKWYQSRCRIVSFEKLWVLKFEPFAGLHPSCSTNEEPKGSTARMKA